MRSTIIVAATLALGVMGKPLMHKHPKRDGVATVYNYNYKTVYVPGEGSSQPTPVPQAQPQQQNAAAPAAPAAPVYNSSPKQQYANSPRPHQVSPNQGQGQSQGSGGSSTPAGNTAAPGDYQQLVLDHHNAHRANHSAPGLSWDAGLAQKAQRSAQTCVFQHDMSQGGSYGQNIAAGMSPAQIGNVISDMFYNGECEAFTGYGMANPGGNFEAYGHFTQVVWKSTTSVGCYTASCPGGVANGGGCEPYFTVCNYAIAGNMAGDYASNVLEPLGKPPVTGATKF